MLAARDVEERSKPFGFRRSARLKPRLPPHIATPTSLIAVFSVSIHCAAQLVAGLFVVICGRASRGHQRSRSESKLSDHAPVHGGRDPKSVRNYQDLRGFKHLSNSRAISSQTAICSWQLALVNDALIVMTRSSILTTPAVDLSFDPAARNSIGSRTWLKVSEASRLTQDGACGRAATIAFSRIRSLIIRC